MQNPILSWRTNRNNATFITAPEIYCTLMLVHDNSGFPQCPWMGPYSTTHIATQINIKFSSQNLFAVGIIHMAHKRLVMQRQQRAVHNKTTISPLYSYPNYSEVMRPESRRTCQDRYSYKDMMTHKPAFPCKMRNVRKKQYEHTRAGNSIPTTCI
jgi:hypothetical protein